MALEMCEGSNGKNVNMPENADKILFAEDFVNHILLQFTLPYLSSSIADHRPIVYNAFSPDVRVATNFLYRRLEKENLAEFEKILKENTFNRNTFLNYVMLLTRQYLSVGFDPQKLLHFCVKIATMAARFHTNGFAEGPALAVENITYILKDFDMASGGWDRLNTVAANYARIYLDVDGGHLTPDSGSELESESGSQNSLSSDSSDASHLTAQDTAGDESKKDELDSASDESSASSEEKNSIASCSKRTHVRNANDIKDDTQKKFPDTPSDSESSGSSEDITANASGSVNPEAQTSSEDNGKNQKIDMQNKESSYAYFRDSDEEDSDIFDVTLPAAKLSDLLFPQQARKRPASSSSSVSELYISESMQEPRTPTSSVDFTTDADINASVIEQESKPGPSNVKTSPIRKHVSKTRRK